MHLSSPRPLTRAAAIAALVVLFIAPGAVLVARYLRSREGWFPWHSYPHVGTWIGTIIIFGIGKKATEESAASRPR